MANRRFIDFPIASTVGDNDIVLIWQDGLNKQTTKGTLIQGAPTSLEGLTDVDIAGLINGQILQYNSVTGKWENVDRTGLNLSELGDVSIVSPSNGQVLVYNSTTSKWENSSAGFVPYVGAVTTVDLGAQGLRAGYVRFNTSVVSVPNEQGLMYWDGDDETIAVILNGYIMKIGEDQFYPVKNQTGSSIAKGTAVRFAGTLGASGRLLIAPFIADGSVSSSFFMGVTAEAIANGADGKVLYFGRIRGINTNAFNEGDVLYASTTVAGGFQTAVPVAPNNIVQVAAVINKSINQGVIFIRPSFGSNINQDEGVKIVSPTTGQLLQLQANGLWENKTTAQVLGGTSSQFVKGDGTLDSNTYQVTSEKGQPNGYASLDSNGKVPLVQINDALIGNVNFQGLWNAATNTPTLANPPASGTKGHYYIVSTAGTFASISFEVGDWIISDGTAWGKVDNTDAVSSVFGRTGNVTAANGDYTTAQVTESGNLYYTDGRARGALSFVAGSGAYDSSTGVITIPTNNNQITNGAGYITSAALGAYLPLAGGTMTGAILMGSSVAAASNSQPTALSYGLLQGFGTFTLAADTDGSTSEFAVITSGYGIANATPANGLAVGFNTLTWKNNAVWHAGNLTNPVTGTGTTDTVPKFTGSSTIGNSQIIDNGTTVGIGVTPTTNKLEVGGGLTVGTGFTGNTDIRFNNATNGKIHYVFSDSITGELGIESGASVGIKFNTNGFNTRMAIFSDGNVTIGNTPSNAGFKLDVNGTGRFSDKITSSVGNNAQILTTQGATTGYQFLDIVNTSGRLVIAQEGMTAGTVFIGTTAYASAIGTAVSRDFQIGTNNTIRLTIAAATGAATFSNIVTAQGRIISGPGAFRNGGFYIPSSTANTGSRTWAMTNDELEWGDFSIITSSTQTGDINTRRLYITSGGNVLIGTTSDNGSRLRVNGSVALPHVTKTENYTLDGTDYTVGFDCASNRTANLPDATTCAGRIYVIYQYNTNIGLRYVTIDGNGSQTINGLTTVNLQYQDDFSSVMIQSNGSNWVVISSALYAAPV